MKKLKNKILSGIYRIILFDEGITYELEDSIVLKGSETFQLFTDQEKLEVLKITDKYYISGEYQPTHIDTLPVVEETIYIDQIFLIYDQIINQIVAFSIKSNYKDYFFTRYADEINFVEKNEYEILISNISDMKIEEL